VRIEPVDPSAATDAQYAALNALANELRRERLPEDPPVPLAEDIRRWRSIPPVVRVAQWIAWDGDAPVGEARTECLRTGENRHLLQCSIGVRGDRRRRGIATRLLERIADDAAGQGRHTLLAVTVDTVPAGAAFMRRLGARPGLETHMNQLDLATVDRDLLRRWQERARERAAGFELVRWIDDVPEEALAGLAQVLEAMNRAPRGALQVEDEHWTPEHIRQFARSDRERGNEVWTMVARERASGALAGFTQVAWHPSRPEIVEQRGTGVLPQYQNRGLGRWMKAAMLELILRERPQAARVRTGNADANAPMLKINAELGFRPVLAHTVWQVELPQVRDYLQAVRATKLAPA